MLWVLGTGFHDCLTPLLVLRRVFEYLMDCKSLLKLRKTLGITLVYLLTLLDFIHCDDRGIVYNYVEDCDPVQCNINIFAACLTIDPFRVT